MVDKLFLKLLWWEPIGILLLSIPLLLPTQLQSIKIYPFLVLALFTFWPLAWLVKRRTEKKKICLSISQRSNSASHPLNLLINFIVIWLVISLYISANRSDSWFSIGPLCLGIASFTACLRWPPSKEQPWVIAVILLLVGGLLAVTAPFIVTWKPQFRLFYLPLYDLLPSLSSYFGETIHANIMAGALTVICPLWLALALRSWETAKVARYICILFIFFTLSILLLTQSRGAYLAVLLALSTVLVVRWTSLLYAIPLLTTLLFAIGYFIDRQTLLQQFSIDGSLGGWNFRLEIWRLAVDIIGDFPITGIGIGTFTTVVPLFYPLSFPIESYPHAHNLFLQVAVDLGLPGLIAYLALLINLSAMLIVTLRRAPRHTLVHSLAIGAAGSLVGMLVHGLLDAVLWGTKLAFLPWLLFALITQLFLQTVAAVQDQQAAKAA